jgi:hypothetical protein
LEQLFKMNRYSGFNQLSGKGFRHQKQEKGEQKSI